MQLFQKNTVYNLQLNLMLYWSFHVLETNTQNPTNQPIQVNEDAQKREVSEERRFKMQPIRTSCDTAARAQGVNSFLLILDT